LIFSYGYRFERAHSYEIDPDPFLPFDETLNIAPLTASLTWDTRDELLDATRGFFTSHGFEYAPSLLGSDLRYIKYLGQYFRYFPLTEPDEIPFGQGKKRSRVIYAVGGRIGLARGFGGQSVIPSERFFSGGGTTVRGFKQNSIGPTDFFGDPEGGEAMLVVNNELRFPIFKFFEGVSFVDVGNVYPRATDFNPFDVRSSAGPGLRVRTPYFLLRLDYGFKLDRKPGESIGEFFFSIGQAF
jgi:outer membrane protein insertion porin family